MILFRIALVLLFSVNAFAWGRRGHALVCETAAALLQNDAAFMKRHTYDLAYYCNVPDLVWRAPATGEIEGPQHYMDMEIFESAFSASSADVTGSVENGAAASKTPSAGKGVAKAVYEIKKREGLAAHLGAAEADPFALSRAEFEATYPRIGVKAGRAFWRIRELDDFLSKTTADLKAAVDAKLNPLFASKSPPGSPTPATESKGKAPADTKPLQLDWLVQAGTMGHYIGDLSMPLHLTEDYDGVKEDQKGVHSYFEDASVDELFTTTDLSSVVRERALKRWKTYAKDRPVLTVLEDLAKQSGARKSDLFKIDRQTGRSDIKKAAHAFEPMIREQLVEGALALAAVWKHHIDGVQFNEDHFYAFASQPAYIYPPGTSATDAGNSKKPPAKSGTTN